MTGAALVAIDPGPFATLQDGGRRDWQRYGVPQSGAMDLASLAVANALVGNPPSTAAVEVMLHGGEWRVDGGACRVAIAGGEFAVSVDGRRFAAHRSLTLERGSRLRIEAAADGAVWGYIAVAGGFALPPQLGSLSTHVRSGLGGVEGRALRPGDALPLGAARSEARDAKDVALAREHLPVRRSPIRVVLGPQDDRFPAASLATFLDGEYRVTHEADRMGYRLSGPTIAHGPRGVDIVSDGVVPGSVQVPGSGQPIVLLMDCQPTGGYPKIATILTVDLPALAQSPPGTTLRFAAVEIAEAQRIHRRVRAALAALPERLEPVARPPLTSEWLLGNNLIGGVPELEPCT